ncbi:Pls/PosA family non-ribosomal peptide synthetase [Tomitella gaofuii]|uniref:Pls/PosA family non-ribosomal peptide synthetase n=1 Tax=Tomitella gaofuii TaxID=2760083 RepID=UPI0015F7F5C5|nr:Pls/PosA family non-ribosomal peptide synthetase [Tomitella gaofuii]
MNEVFERTCDLHPELIAVVVGDREWTYRDLDERANRLAHELVARGAGVDTRIAILLERSIDTYATLLAVLKSGGAFVPIDPASPVDRIQYILSDSGAELLVTTSDFDALTATADAQRILLDADAQTIGSRPAARPRIAAYLHDPAAYIIYTSGSTGRPKGVEIAQSSICNFLTVIPDVYDVRPGDRVYQGMTISFDFSIEEIWPTFAHGATLIAGPTDSRHLGGDLADFLETQHVTMLYCVPTLLATIPRDLPQLRSILVGGEACPRELVERWSSPHRRILNTYGPTEATITATWCELLPGRPVTIGSPVPTYAIVILDDQRDPVLPGEIGEICIGGPGVARGYVGRPDLTADRFIDHRLAPPGSRLYRTGDLGRWTEDGEIEYLGRADDEVKIRGHRVDLGEIESALLEDPDIAGAVVAMMPGPAGGGDELSAYLVLRDGVPPDSGPHDGVPNESGPPDGLLPRLHDHLRDRLPDYMTPTFVDVLDALPAMVSGKVDRKKLPTPTGRRLAGTPSGPVVPPATVSEERVRDLWAHLLGVDPTELSVEADVFTELGGHSLLAAQLVTRLREDDPRSAIGIRDLYRHATCRALAGLLDESAAAGHGFATAGSDAGPPPVTHPRSRLAGAGGYQSAFLLLVLLVVTVPVSIVYHLHGGRATASTLTGLLIATVPTYLGVRWLLPLVLVRPLSRGITPGRYPLWGPTYLRLWTIDRLLALSPLPVLSGSPLIAPFLRALGADVGRAAQLGTASIPLPAMVSVGDGAAVGHNTDLRGWHVRGGEVIVAPVSIGPGAFVGANCVLEPGAAVDAGAMLADQSLAGSGQTIGAAARWAGSPSHEVVALPPMVEELMSAEPAPGPGRRFTVMAAAALAALELAAIATIVPSLVLVWLVLLNYGMIAALIATLFTGFVYVATVCAIVAGGKRLVLPELTPGVHDAYSTVGLRKWTVDKLLEMSLTYTNALYATLYAVPWLRLLGARIGRGAEVSTVAHIDPDLLSVGRDSFVADMASVGGATQARGRFAVARTALGERAFVGNASLLPAGAQAGDGSLVGVLTVPPEDGIPDGSSWLGSPAIHLPTRQDSGDFPEETTFNPPRALVAQRLFIEFFRITLPATVLGVSLYFYLLAVSLVARSAGVWWVILTAPLFALVAAAGVVLYAAAVKNNMVGRYRPRVAPLWDRFVRRSEFATGIYESAAVPVLVDQLRGTPMMGVALRRFGTTVGRGAFIDTTYLTEFDLVKIGDGAAVGHGVSLQTHLFEDRVMKMSHVRVDDRATVGTRAIVLYDSVLGTDAELGSLSLLMKGEQLPARSRWEGIPAQMSTSATRSPQGDGA